jgi:hypothetical protein
LLVLLPLVLTVMIIGWIVGVVAAVLGPGTWLGDLLTSGGEALVGQKREVIAFIVGVGLALASLWLLGLLVRVQARRALDQTFDDVFGRVPLVRAIYRPLSRSFACLQAATPISQPCQWSCAGSEGGTAQTCRHSSPPRRSTRLPVSGASWSTFRHRRYRLGAASFWFLTLA